MYEVMTLIVTDSLSRATSLLGEWSPLLALLIGVPLVLSVVAAIRRMM